MRRILAILIAAACLSLVFDAKAECDPAQGFSHITGQGDGCKWAAWMCQPSTEFGDYELSVVACLDTLDCAAKFAGMNYEQIKAERDTSLADPRMRTCLAPHVERIKSIRPLSRWVVAPNPSGSDPRSRPVYHALPDGTLGEAYPPDKAVAPTGAECDPGSLRALRGTSVYGRPKGWRGDMVTLCRKR